MLVTPFALVTPQIGIDRCGPLMTVVVPWHILQASSRSRKTCSRGRHGDLVALRCLLRWFLWTLTYVRLALVLTYRRDFNYQWKSSLRRRKCSVEEILELFLTPSDSHEGRDC
jgi:hypothetical protein